MTPTEAPPKPLTVGEAAKALGWPPCRVRRAYQTGILEGLVFPYPERKGGKLALYRWSVEKVAAELRGERQ